MARQVTRAYVALYAGGRIAPGTVCITQEGCRERVGDDPRWQVIPCEIAWDDGEPAPYRGGHGGGNV